MDETILNKRINWLDKLLQLNWGCCVYTTKEGFDINILDITKFRKRIESNKKINTQLHIVIGYYESSIMFTKKLQAFIKENYIKYEIRYGSDGTPLKGNSNSALIWLTKPIKSTIFNVDFDLNEDLSDPTDAKLENMDLSVFLNAAKLDHIKPIKYDKKNVKKIVWETYANVDNIDPLSGKCFCCNKGIRLDDMTTEFGHVLARSKNGKYETDNIRPICIQCNRGIGGMHTIHMYEYMVTNKTEGLINLTDKEKWLYSFKETERKILINLVDYVFDYMKEKHGISDNFYIAIKAMIDKEKSMV